MENLLDRLVLRVRNAALIASGNESPSSILSKKHSGEAEADMTLCHANRYFFTLSSFALREIGNALV
jgi:hypothetical protein